MILRPAVGADAAAVAALDQDLFGPDAWSLASVVEEIAGDDRCTVVAFSEDLLLGYAMTMRADDVVDLQRIGVRPAYRRHGIARALLGAVADRAAEEGAHRMLLEVGAGNAAALAFYAAEGFVEIDRRRRYYRDGSDALVLGRPVGPAGSGGRG